MFWKVVLLVPSMSVMKISTRPSSKTERSTSQPAKIETETIMSSPTYVLQVVLSESILVSITEHIESATS